MTEEIKQQMQEVRQLAEVLKQCASDADRSRFLSELPIVCKFLSRHSWLKSTMEGLPPRESICILSVIAIGQGDVVFSHFEGLRNSYQHFLELLEVLVEMDTFYDTIGGIVGYHAILLQLLHESSEQKEDKNREVACDEPPGVSIMEENSAVHQAIKQGIIDLPKLAEMYPLGGAGDRLSLKDEATGEPLPAALLPFLGRSLLAGLIRDVQAREFLYYRLMDKQITTPIAIMTSYEKNNQWYILAIIENELWFGRPKWSFRLFTQPLVPVISDQGEWVMRGPFQLALKPGGHGALWKKASDEKIFDWFKTHETKKILVRQINNPIAGTDYGLLAFIGLGFSSNKSFGFASCRRLIRSAEGINVLFEQKKGEAFTYCISNIEYTDLEKRGIEDIPASEGSPYSAFPANTNILFADIDAVQSALERCPMPGMIINMKNTFRHYAPNGSYKDVKGGRLESTMQNIADVIVSSFASPLDPLEMGALSTYVTYNKRQKTLSVVKNSYSQGGPIQGTPLGGFYDMLLNNRELFVERCGMTLPELNEEGYIAHGPSFVALFHPALGPCWSIIAQKIRGGRLSQGAELQLEIAEVDIENLDLTGSLLIEAQHPLGRLNGEGIIEYSDECGKCVLKNVTVHNSGIDRGKANIYWRNQIFRHEALRIVLQGNAEFYAENVTITGDRFIEVPDGCRLVVTEEAGELKFDRQTIRRPTWQWNYSFSHEGRILLDKEFF